MATSRLTDLSRPIPGQRNTITLASGVRFVKTISRKFLCPKCRTFCGELIPIIDRSVRAWMRKNGKNLMSPELQVKVFCFSGCHDHPAWGWQIFDWASIKDRESVREWPSEWSTREIQNFEKEARRIGEAHKRGG